MAKKHVRSFYIFTILALLLSQFGLIPAVAAGNFTVNSTTDAVDDNPGDGVCETATPGVCTLRAAIQEANALSGADMIALPAGTYTLSIAGTGEDAAATGDLDITGSLEIVGAEAETTIIDADDLDRVFQIFPHDSLTAQGLTIRNGNGDMGSGVYVAPGGTFILNEGVIADNIASSGGGVFSSGNTTIRGSLVVNNSSSLDDGGGLFASSTGIMILENSTVANNSAANYGGGLVTTGNVE
ncbi:MAG: CSLREA domain-containing protein, partial [Anaerolineales bacterium]